MSEIQNAGSDICPIGRFLRGMEVRLYFHWYDNLLLKGAIVLSNPQVWNYLRYKRHLESGRNYLKVYDTLTNFYLLNRIELANLLNSITDTGIDCVVDVHTRFLFEDMIYKGQPDVKITSNFRFKGKFLKYNKQFTDSPFVDNLTRWGGIEVRLYFNWADNLLLKAAIICALPYVWEKLSYTHKRISDMLILNTYDTFLWFPLNSQEGLSELINYLKAMDIDCTITTYSKALLHLLLDDSACDIKIVLNFNFQNETNKQ
jgi:hypothetical protein